MERTTTARSSMIRAIGFDARKNILQVEMKNGRAYHYAGVPKETYRSFLSAPSQGKYYNQFIKNQFPGQRVP